MSVRAGLHRRPVRRICASLDEAQLANIARERGLRDIEPGALEQPPQLFLAAHWLLLHDVENHRLAACLHVSSNRGPQLLRIHQNLTIYAS